MTKPKFIFTAAAFFLACLLCPINSFGQTPDKAQTEASYELVLQILTASDNAAGKSAAVVPELANVIKKLKADYPLSNYRVSATYLQRIASTGSAEFKGVSGEPNQDVFAPVFSEWTINQMLSMPDARGRDSVSIRGFRFGQRVPIRTAVSGGDEKGGSIVNYEQIGINISRLNLPVNTPTVIGNLSGSKPDESAFLILTVRPE